MCSVAQISLFCTLLCLSLSSVTCFLSLARSSAPRIHKNNDCFRKTAFRSLQALKDDNQSKSSLWMEELRAREHEVAQQEREIQTKWKKANCSSAVSAVLPDWVRRIDVGNYPLAALGSAQGTIYVASLETGEIIAQSDQESQETRYPKKTPEKLEETLRLLYGSYDGGGTVAVAFSGTLVCEAQRDGGVHLWRLDTKSKRLVSQGYMKALEGVLVTCLHLEEDYLYVGRADGKLQAFPLDDHLPLALETDPDWEWNVDSTILSFSLSQDIGCGVVTTAKGSVELLDLEDDEHPIGSFYPPFDSSERKSSNAHPLCATIFRNDTLRKRYSIACGGNDGSLFVQSLEMSNANEVDCNRPFLHPLRKLRPRHFGPVKCMASPAPGLLVSGGQDGTMRVWNVEDQSCMYQFVGYKVWLGSLWTDGTRIVSDGSDNTVIVHDFC